MNENTKIGTEGNEMTYSQEVAALHKFFREDITGLHRRLEERDRRLHDKLDKHIDDGNVDLRCIQKQLSALDKITTINTFKLSFYVSVVAIAATTVVHYGIPIIMSH